MRFFRATVGRVSDVPAGLSAVAPDRDSGLSHRRDVRCGRYAGTLLSEWDHARVRAHNASVAGMPWVGGPTAASLRLSTAFGV